MTSIPVMDVGSFFTSASKVQGSGAGKTGDFQSVWDAQTEKGDWNVANRDVRDTERAAFKPEESRQTAPDKHPQKTSERLEQAARAKKPQEDTKTSRTEELTDEELEEAIEVLGTAAYGMLQQIAEMLGMDMQELQSAMDALGVEQMDLLKSGDLNNLLLQLGGFEPYELVADEALYLDYRSLMGQLDSLLEDSAGQLSVSPEELEALLTKISEETMEVAAGDMAQVSEPVIELVDAAGALDEVDSEEMGTALSETMVSAKAVQAVGFENADGSNAQKQGSKEQETGGGRRETEGVSDHAAYRGNAFAAQTQTMPADSFANQMQAVQTAYTDSPWDEQTMNILRQITDSVKLQITADTQSMEIQLHPASLGNVQVNVASRGGVITANFVTENETVKAALESQMLQLRDSFAEQGVRVEAIEVTVQPHAFERNLDQGRGGNHSNQNSPRRGRVRRIQLDGTIPASDLEEDERLVAELMEANGNTVDYMA